MQRMVAEATAKASVVLVVDPMVLRRAGLVTLMREWAEANQVAITAILPDCIDEAATANQRYALAVLGLGGVSLGDQIALGWLRRLVESLPQTPLVVVSDCDSHAEVVAAFRAGARGFIPTSTDPVVTLQAFTFIMGGGSYFPPGTLLSPRGAVIAPRGAARASARKEEDIPATLPTSSLSQRQRAVLMRLQEGQSNKAIAQALGMKEPTVKVHVRQIMKKLGAANRTQAALASFPQRPPAPKPAAASTPALPAADDRSLPAVPAADDQAPHREGLNGSDRTSPLTN